MEDNEEDLGNITGDKKYGRASDCPYEATTAVAQTMIERQTRHSTDEKRCCIDQMSPKIQDLGEVELRIRHDVLDVLIMPSSTSVDDAYT